MPVAVPGVTRAVGLQETLVGVMMAELLTVIVPPVPEMEAAVPSGTAAYVLPMAIGTEPLPVTARVMLTTATAPLAMVLAFSPDAKHIVEPLAVLQDT